MIARTLISYGAGPRANPLVSEGKVYTLGAKEIFFVSNGVQAKSSGKRISKGISMRKLRFGVFRVNYSLRATNLFALTGGEQATVSCFDKTNGRELWGGP